MIVCSDPANLITYDGCLATTESSGKVTPETYLVANSTAEASCFEEERAHVCVQGVLELLLIAADREDPHLSLLDKLQLPVFVGGGHLFVRCGL